MSSNQPFNTPSRNNNGLGGASPSRSMSGAQARGLHGPQGGSALESKDSNSNVGEVKHTEYLAKHIGALYLENEYSDVSLVVEGVTFTAHRVVLAARSEYFRALFFGGMRESQQQQIELKDTNLDAFKFLLKYIYTGQMTLSNLKDDLILEILGLAHQYGFQDLESAISDYLIAVLDIANVCLIYDTATLYQLHDLVIACGAFMDAHAAELIAHESFKTLTATGIRNIISRDSFCAPEVDIFRAVLNWVHANPGEEAQESILDAVRLSLMSTTDLLKVVRPTGLVPPDRMLDAIQARTECRDMELKYRGFLIPDENVAIPTLGASVLIGEVKQALLDGDSKNYDMERGFSRHPIDDTHDSGIVVKLGSPYIINHLKMLLWDRDQRAYSYFIEVSMDQNDWVRVVDYSRYYCRSWQFLYFPPRVVRYIRIVGTHNTVNKVFHVVTLEAYFTKNAVPVVDRHGLVYPMHNVATIPMSALCTEGVCRSRNALLNGDTSNYDWDSGYTCHQLGSGCIIIQLGQPYLLDSMRILLWDCDDRSYSYYVEVSTNGRDWMVVCDRSRENCKSWQIITFPRRPVVFVKIVGTHNTANEVFHIVHFECPSATKSSSYSEDAIGIENRDSRMEANLLSAVSEARGLALSESDSEALQEGNQHGVLQVPDGIDLNADLEARSDLASDGSSVRSHSVRRDDIVDEQRSPGRGAIAAQWPTRADGSSSRRVSGSLGMRPSRSNSVDLEAIGAPGGAGGAAANAFFDVSRNNHAAVAFYNQDHFRLAPSVPRGAASRANNLNEAFGRPLSRRSDHSDV